MKSKSRRWSILFSIVTWVLYMLGVWWRWVYLTRWHDPRKYVYSDMAMYMSLAKRLAPPDYVVKIGDVTHPPGMTWLIEYFLHRDPSFEQLVYFNFIVCALLPLAIGALGWVAFGRRTAEISIIIASGNYAFVDFGGYFLAEIHMALVSTLTIALYLFAMKIAERKPSPGRTVGFVAVSVLGGLFFSLAMTLKMVAMPAIGGFCILHFLFTHGPKRTIRAAILAIFVLSAAPLTGFVAARCTKANNGHFCSGSNKSAADFLLGHYGRIAGVQWNEPTGGFVGFGSPAAYQHGYTHDEVVHFSIVDQKRNNEAAWTWIDKHPSQSLVNGVEHVFDAFGTYPWPPNSLGIWPGSYAAHYAFLFLMIIPTMILLVDVLRGRGVMGLLRSTELVVFSPIIGLIVALFVATGEERYRVPWDGVFVVLGVEFFRRLRLRRSRGASFASVSAVS